MVNKENYRLKLITTEDGSHSLLREDLNETYHSFHGAMGESQYVFMQQGVDYLLDQKEMGLIRIFEVGFGTGLNAFLAAVYAAGHQVNIDFHTVEPIPVPEELFLQFNYGESASEQGLLQALHRAAWGTRVVISDCFSITKYATTLQDFQTSEKFDVVFFDAFAPSKQAELWDLVHLKKCADLMAAGGVLTTYCAQGQFKRNLAAAGFEVQTLKGAMGKKEMVRGIKK